MLIQELFKIFFCLIGGLILGLTMGAQDGKLVMIPFYVLGFVYGFNLVFPWIIKAMGGLMHGAFSSILMKSLLGFLVILIVAPLVLGGLLSVGWVAGICNVFMNLFRAFQQDRLCSKPFKVPGKSIQSPFKPKKKTRPPVVPKHGRFSDDPFGDDFLP